MKFEHITVANIEGALRGMRNPMMSHSRMDSIVTPDGNVIIGQEDYRLAKNLIIAGEPHRKFLRQIFVSVDIVKMPSYLMHEFATYKIGTTMDCSSTMHKITSRPLTEDDFEPPTSDIERILLGDTIQAFNLCRENYLTAKRCNAPVEAEKHFVSMKHMLPHSYLYERMTWTANYEVLTNIWKWRHNHRLPAWHQFCHDFIEPLPHSYLITQKWKAED